MPRELDNTIQRLPICAQSIIAADQAQSIRDAKQLVWGIAVGTVALIAILNWL